MTLFVKRALFLVIIILGPYVYLKTNYYISRTTDDAARVANIALQQNNPSLCDRIIIPFQIFPGETQEGLRSVCYKHVAESLKNPEICNGITHPALEFYKDAVCISNIAAETNNINSCDLITEQSAKGGCYEYFTERGSDKSVCEKVGEADNYRHSGRDLCYFGAAKYSNDVSICDTKIKETNYKNQCYSIVGIQTKNIKICDKISGEYSSYEKEDCKETILRN